MRARTGLWEPWGGNAPGPPGPTRAMVGIQPRWLTPKNGAIDGTSERTISGRLTMKVDRRLAGVPGYESFELLSGCHEVRATRDGGRTVAAI